MKQDVTPTIVAFTAHLGDPQDDPVRKARERGWICEANAPTGDGLALAEALADQSGTRSTFRHAG